MRTRTGLALVVAGALLCTSGVYNSISLAVKTEEIRQEYSTKISSEEQRKNQLTQVLSNNKKIIFYTLYGTILGPCICTLGGAGLYENYSKRKLYLGLCNKSP